MAALDERKWNEGGRGTHRGLVFHGVVNILQSYSVFRYDKIRHEYVSSCNSGQLYFESDSGIMELFVFRCIFSTGVPFCSS